MQHTPFPANSKRANNASNDGCRQKPGHAEKKWEGRATEQRSYKANKQVCKHREESSTDGAALIPEGDRRIPGAVGKGYLKLRHFVMGEPSYFFYGGCV